MLSGSPLYLVLVSGVLLGGADPEPTAVSEQLDGAIEGRCRELQVTPAGLADDSTFLRRAWLDLAGRVPSALEAREFLKDTRADKRERLVDELLQSEDFADNWARNWTIRLTEKRPIRHQIHDGRVLQEYLREALQSGKSYRQIASELILADGPRDASGPVNFLLRYDAKPEPLAGAVGRHFLGATLHCAQCHDHVFASWRQEDFRGLAAYFGRLKLMNSEDGSLYSVVEARRGEFQITEPGTKQAPDGTIPMTTVLPRLPAGETPARSPKVPRREQLVAWLTADDNPWFARHAVNTTWQALFGTPLVPSLDDPAAAIKTEHGPLLDLLANDFVAGGYNVKRLVRIIVLSRAYQRATAVPPQVSDAAVASSDVVVHAQLQALAAYPVRPLSVDQLYYSINQATGNRSSEEATVEPAPDAEPPDDEARAFSDGAVEVLGEHGVNMQRALVLLTGPFAQDAVQSGARVAVSICGRRIGRPHIEWLFLATLSRLPTEEEQAKMLDLIRQDQGTRGLEDMLWILLNSAEFVTNH